MAKTKKKKAVTLSQFNGDHGTGTIAAKAGTVIERMDGPNKMARRRRKLQSDTWRERLSGRQYQAAQAIENAYSKVEALGSGGDSVAMLGAVVDSTPRPDAIVDIQTSAQSHLQHVMKAVRGPARPVIEHLFWHNLPLGRFAQGKAFYNRTAEVKVALDLVANHLRY